MSSTILILFLAFLISYLLTNLIRTYTLRRGILDVPNQRSSHEQPTPRGGGLAIVGVALIGWVVYSFRLPPEARLPLWGCLAGAALIALVSGLDDIRPLSNRVRFAAHCGAALLALGGLGFFDTIALPLFGEIRLSWVGLPLTLLWIVGLTNAYNFMDGIDGLAGSQGVVAGLGWSLLGWLSGQPLLSLLGLLLTAGSLGFLGHNWSPARIFMGDVGSAFLGYTFAIFPLLALSPPQGDPWLQAPVVAMLLLWPFLFDTAFTFLRRLRAGENVFAAHRSHLYQRLVIAGYSHAAVTLLYTGLAIMGLVLALNWSLTPLVGAINIAVLLPLLCAGLWQYVRIQDTVTAVTPQASGVARWKGRKQMVNTEKSPGLAPKIRVSPVIRVFDLVGAGLLLLLLAPLFLLIGLLIKFTSSGPTFFTIKQRGQAGRIFKLYRFRIRYLNSQPGQTPGSKHRPPLTPVGRFLRRSKLDILPQLINVLRGEMGLVGPKLLSPDSPSPVQPELLLTRPGIISPSSVYPVAGRTILSNDLEHDTELSPKLALELTYFQQRNIWSDLKIILRRAWVMIKGGKVTNGLLNLRNRYFFLFDVAFCLLTPAAALTLRLDQLNWWLPFGPALMFYTIVALVIKILFFYSLGLYRLFWRYAGVNELSRIIVAVATAALLLSVLFWGIHPWLALYDLAFPRTVPLVDGLLTGLMVGGLRVGLRGLHHWQQHHRGIVCGRRVLVVGAGEAGTNAVSEMRANPALHMEPVAFIDDDPLKANARIAGLPVLGSSQNLHDIVNQYDIQGIIVAIPSAPLKRQHELIAACRQTGLAVHNLPGMYELLAGYKTLSPAPRFDINRLLGRSPIAVDPGEISDVLQGAVVLVTGAGGSIGSELCRQIARFEPQAIVLLGHGENSIFEIGLDLKLSFPDLPTYPVIVDVRNQQRVEWAVEKYRPDVIFHAAAHKHVPFMEANIAEAVTNNVIGTRNVLRAAEKYGVERFLLISTDKAVNPASVMGATKRLAELLVIATAQRTGRAYVAVRFGNVLGSRGSVVPTFQRQIAAGGPVTVTHPAMTRYFMTIPEAVQLVLQASILGQGSEIFVLDMGQPIRILDLAKNLLDLSGLKLERDIEIVYTGVRPGEKLSEELFLAAENYQRTKQEKIFRATQSHLVDGEALERDIAELIDTMQHRLSIAESEEVETMLPYLCHCIDKYQPQPQVLPSPAEVKSDGTISANKLYPRSLPAGS